GQTENEISIQLRAGAADRDRAGRGPPDNGLRGNDLAASEDLQVTGRAEASGGEKARVPLRTRAGDGGGATVARTDICVGGRQLSAAAKGQATDGIVADGKGIDRG